MLAPTEFLRKFIEIDGTVLVCVHSCHELIDLFWAYTQIKLSYGISEFLGGYLAILVRIKIIEDFPHGSRGNL